MLQKKVITPDLDTMHMDRARPTYKFGVISLKNMVIMNSIILEPRYDVNYVSVSKVIPWSRALRNMTL